MGARPGADQCTLYSRGGSCQEAIALLETLMSSAPHSAEARTLLAQARSRSAVPPTLAQAAVDVPLDSPSSLPAEETWPEPHTLRPSRTKPRQLHGHRERPRIVRSEPESSAVSAPSDIPSRIKPLSAVSPAVGVSEIGAPSAAPVSPSMAEEPAFVATAPEDQRWKVVLLVVPLALAVLVFFGFQRLTAGSERTR